MLSGALEALEGRAGSGVGGVVAPLMLVIVFLSNNL